ncbi:MAG TPA: helix-turn-helix domain-containing protein [Candidatus Krumholzibacteria bacterium]|nr:helix-turn-helix domain-containing protein [Candidatus Krumholzibacteria bacterium]HRX52701.1 helix-turn-helix domain-containing protein [Candidatus Krumholzibacteria bacterium]
MTPTYSLDDLAAATGFTPRQIRYYITRKLAPGAGERGPEARYGQETLDRLRLIVRLKEVRVQPTGRALTLDEIRETLDSLGGDGAEMVLEHGVAMTLIDTDARRPEPDMFLVNELRQPYLTDLFGEIATSSSRQSHGLGHLGPLLRSLRGVLVQALAHDDPQDSPASAAEPWLRARIPDIEIQVRVPDGRARGERLERILGDLDRLLG